MDESYRKKKIIKQCRIVPAALNQGIIHYKDQEKWKEV